MSFSETIFLFFLALVIFGPKKLPEIARQAGKLLAEFRRASNDFKSQIEQEVARLEVEDRKKTMLPSVPAPSGTASRTLDASTITSTSTPVTTESADTAARASTTSGPSSDEPLFATHSPENMAGEVPAESASPEPVTSSASRDPHA